MKQFFTTVFCLLVISISAQEKNFKQFYKSHKKQAEVSLNIPGFIARWFIEGNDDEEFEELLDKARNYKILVSENNTTSIQKDFKAFVKYNKLKTIIKVKDKGDRVNIHFREENNKIKEIIINVFSGNEESVLVGLKTNLTKEELSSIIRKSKVKTASNKCVVLK